MLKDNKATVAEALQADGPVWGTIHGTATMKVQMKPTGMVAGKGHPADVLGDYVREQVKALMNQFGSIPTEITVGFDKEYDI